MVPVLFVTGPIGVGKTTVLHEADSLLIGAGVRHATVELEEIARCWTETIETARPSFVYQNLQYPARWSPLCDCTLRSRSSSSGFVSASLPLRTANWTGLAHAGRGKGSPAAVFRTAAGEPETMLRSYGSVT